MSSIIIPASHERSPVDEPLDIAGKSAIVMNWYWDLTNKGAGTGYVDYWIELSHDIGGFLPGFANDVPWVIYGPSSALGDDGLEYMGAYWRKPEQKDFWELKDSIKVAPGGEVPPGATRRHEGSLSIPGPGDSTKAREFWENQFSQHRGMKFHLTVKLYQHPESLFDFRNVRAKLLGEHRWENLFELPNTRGRRISLR